MSLDKAIEHGKDHRKQYRGSKSFDCTCRNHGGCEWCLENRMIQKLRREEAMKQEEDEYKEHTIEYYMYGHDMGNLEDGSL